MTKSMSQSSQPASFYDGLSKQELAAKAAGIRVTDGTPRINGATDAKTYYDVQNNPDKYLDKIYDVIENYYHIYDTVTIEATNVGGRTCQEHTGTLTKQMQLDFALLSIYAEVDYTLILGTMLHESSWQEEPPDWNGTSTASGCMQLLDSIYNDYAADSGAYYDEYSDMRALAEKLGADFSQKNDFLANATVGMCAYMEWQSYSFGADISQVVNHYGDGSTVEENYYYVNGEKKYLPSIDWVLSSSTIEILYYRDLLALEAGIEPWYIGKLYDKDGNRLEQ